MTERVQAGGVALTRHVREDGLLQHNRLERSALEAHRSLQGGCYKAVAQKASRQVKQERAAESRLRRGRGAE